MSQKLKSHRTASRPNGHSHRIEPSLLELKQLERVAQEIERCSHSRKGRNRQGFMPKVDREILARFVDPDEIDAECRQFSKNGRCHEAVEPDFLANLDADDLADIDQDGCICGCTQADVDGLKEVYDVSVVDINKGPVGNIFKVRVVL